MPLSRTKQSVRHYFIQGLLATLIALMAFAIAACGGESTPGTGSSNNAPATTPKATTAPPADLITPGVLTVGSDTTYPPQEYIDTATGQAAGFDIDLIRAIGERMGLKVNVVTAKFDSIIDSLVAKRYDVAMSAITITSDRQQKVDFIPYFKAGESLLVQQGNPKNIKSVSDLCGLDVGVQNGTVEQPELQTASDDCKKAGKEPIKMTVLQDQTAVIQLLATNRVVATYQDSPVTDYYLKQNPGRFEVGGTVVNVGTEGIALRKGDTDMMKALTTAFDAIKADGTYKQVGDKWGVAPGLVTAVERRNVYA